MDAKMSETTLVIRKAGFGRWEVIGCNEWYGSSDSDQSPVCPPSFRTRKDAVEFAGRVIGRGEATAYRIEK